MPQSHTWKKCLFCLVKSVSFIFANYVVSFGRVNTVFTYLYNDGCKKWHGRMQCIVPGAMYCVLLFRNTSICPHEQVCACLHATECPLFSPTKFASVLQFTRLLPVCGLPDKQKQLLGVAVQSQSVGITLPVDQMHIYYGYFLFVFLKAPHKNW